jgi:hypothetical protein
VLDDLLLLIGRDQAGLLNFLNVAVSHTRFAKDPLTNRLLIIA